MYDNDFGLSALAVDLLTVGVEGTVPTVFQIGPGDLRDALALPNLEDDTSAACTVLDDPSGRLFYVLRLDGVRLLAVIVPD